MVKNNYFSNVTRLECYVRSGTHDKTDVACFHSMDVLECLSYTVSNVSLLLSIITFLIFGMFVVFKILSVRSYQSSVINLSI